MNFNFNFRPWEIIFRWANGNPAAELAEIKKILTKMANQQEQLNALVAELKTQIADERAEVLDAIEAIDTSKPLDLSGVEALKEEIENIFNKVPPAPGKHNITLGFRSTGDEVMSATITDNNCDDEQAARLRAIFDTAVVAGQAQASGGGLSTRRSTTTTTEPASQRRSTTSTRRLPPINPLAKASLLRRPVSCPLEPSGRCRVRSGVRARWRSTFMSLHDPRTFKARLTEYVANHAQAAHLNFERAQASGNQDDKEWSVFLSEATIFAENKLNALLLRDRLDG
jgi:hypothetical protein